MNSRRRFITAAGVGLAASSARVLGANERIRLGIIGPGAQGMSLVREAMACPGTEMVAFADIYTARLEAGRKVAPGAKTYMDHRSMLEDKSIDAVLIATPQHLHCQHFVDTLAAGKHVYQEKTMAFTVEHAKRMREAHRKAPKQVVQIGHQSCSSGQVTDAQAFLADNKVGKITALHAHMYRNTPHGRPQWSREVQPDMTQENILWDKFLGEAQKRPFDANRYINWRFFWDYSGGNVYENMCHQLSFWYKVIGLAIPEAVTMTGGVYLWKDGREVPDTMNVSMEHREEVLFSWDSAFGNDALGSSEHVLGTDGTIFKGREIRYDPQKVNRPGGVALTGQTKSGERPHMQNFLDAIRTGVAPNCPFDVGFRVSIACRMAVDSYRQKRTMRWDPTREEIV